MSGGVAGSTTRLRPLSGLHKKGQQMRQYLAWGVISLAMLTGCAKSPAPPTEAQETSNSPAPVVETEAVPAPVSTGQNAAVQAVQNDASNPVIGRKLLSAEEAAAGWLALFDGSSLFGWKSSHDDINWKVENGMISADSGSNGMLLSTVPFADFELVVEYQMAPEGNSGIFVRCQDVPTGPTDGCYEINIADKHGQGFLTGSIVARKTATKPIIGSGGWQTLRIIALGNRLQIFHDGEAILDFTDEAANAPRGGYIGLQKNSGQIQFRRVNLKPLNQQSLFNGKDLSGWRIVPGNKSEFTVQDQAIHVVNGQGFLETEQTWQNFIFQTQVKTGAVDLNSGFFFRAMPGTEKAPSNGYEVQVHNGIKDGNRNQPANAGTGAIFRRVEARRVVSNDLEWCTVTLVANGPHISVWVDGYQEVAWEDTRMPDENPRKGQRLEGGHLSLQGHDPTTDVWFRALSIAELPKLTTPAVPADSKGSESK